MILLLLPLSLSLSFYLYYYYHYIHYYHHCGDDDIADYIIISIMIVIVFQSDNILNFPVLIMNIWGVHMSPKYWNEPEKFNPRRFLSEDGKTVLTPPTLIPFGLGESFQTFKALVSKCFILQSRRCLVEHASGASIHFWYGGGGGGLNYES